MKFLFLILFTLITLFSDETKQEIKSDNWQLYRFNVYFEDDIYVQTDDEYSAGERFSWLYYIQNPQNPLFHLLFLDFGGASTYVNFALTNQIFTPTDTHLTELIKNDRPYAGWTYFEMGLHKSSQYHLRSLSLKIGAIGEISGSEIFQNGIHKIIGSEQVNGWDNQLSNELGIDLKYSFKWRYEPKSLTKVESSIIPFAQIELGNISTKASAGILTRFGHNIPKDFGVSAIDIGGEDGVPVYKEMCNSVQDKWSYSFNFNLAGTAVARDIFLDGNTNVASHSVEKKRYIAYLGAGFSLRYNRFSFDFIQTFNSKKFNTEKGTHGVGTLVVSWIYN